jgi:hypothetical protein
LYDQKGSFFLGGGVGVWGLFGLSRTKKKREVEGEEGDVGVKCILFLSMGGEGEVYIYNNSIQKKRRRRESVACEFLIQKYLWRERESLEKERERGSFS